jgi:predicted amidohydrolase
MDLYTAAIIQPIQRNISHRVEIKSVLTRYLKLIDFITSEGVQANKEFAPVKLVTFPEFFLQGLDRHWGLKRILEDIAISIPGEETAILANKAKQYKIYIAGAALEVDSEWKDRFFNTAFIIDPDGRVIHKYRKFAPATYVGELALSPHDMYDEYVARYGESLNTFFPVTDTLIGKIGTMICMDSNFPEISRALAINGAEIIIRPTSYHAPLISSPLNYWELQNRTRAWENLVYMIAPNTGIFIDTPFPQLWAPGHSMIVSYDGSILAEIPHPGEGVVSGVINLDILRKRRKDVNRNLLAQLRTEVFKLIYKDPVYPKNRCLKEPYRDIEDIAERGSLTPIIEEFFKKGIYTKPKFKD